MNKLEKTIKNLGIRRTINFNNQVFKLICLLREEDRRPFQAEWWRGKESYLIAVDENGNFFLRHSGGHIFRLDPISKNEEIIAKSESEFLDMIEQGY